jgi:hypothetical protein
VLEERASVHSPQPAPTIAIAATKRNDFIIPPRDVEISV